MVGDDSSRTFTALRLTAAGVLDTAFGGEGLFRYDRPTADFGTWTDITGVTAAPDGGAYLLGSDRTTGPLGLTINTPLLLKLTPAGDLDTSFDGDGHVPLPTGDYGSGLDLVTQPDGKLLVATTRYDSSFSASPLTSVEVLRFHADGTPDAGFGVAGRSLAILDGGYGDYGSLALLPDGRVVVASGRRGAGDAGVAVLNADGSRDTFVSDFESIQFGPRGAGGTSVNGVAVSGDEVVLLVSFLTDSSDVSYSRQSQLGLAVLTESPGVLPLTPVPPVVVYPPLPPYVPGEGAGEEAQYHIPPLPGEFTVPIPDPDSPDPTSVAFPVIQQRPTDNDGPGENVMVTTSIFLVPNDVNGDGVADKVVTDGAKVSLVSGKDGSVLVKPFAPFEASYTGTLNAVFVDLDGVGKSVLVVTPASGGGPVVAVYNADGTERVRFWGIDDAGFRGGVSLAFGDVNLDGRPDLIVTAGAGGGPRVAIFDGQTLGANARRLVADFFAFEEGQRGGATAGVVDGVLIFAAGPGGGPRVRGIDALSLFAAGGVKSLDDLPTAARKFDRFVGDSSSRQGVTLDFSGVNYSLTDHPRKVMAESGDGKPEAVYERPGFGPAT